jgi:hypothetical protein
MRNIHKAQPAGAEAFMDAVKQGGLNAADEPANVHKLEVADDAPESDSLPPWVNGNELLAFEEEAPEVLICGPEGSEEGAVLRLGSKLVVGGGSKMGKTWCLVDLALAVASGGKWLGHFQCKQGAVLYVNLELRRHTAGRRVRWIAEKRGLCKGTGLRPEVSAAIHTWNLRGKCYDLVTMLSTARMRLKEERAPKFALIILDPIYKTYGDKDENSAGDMAALMLEIERFADELGAAIAFAAHFSKGNQSGKEAMDRISGSGVMARDPDAIMTFTNHEEEDCYTLEAILREFAPIPPLVLQWEAPVMNPRGDLDPAKLRQPGKTKDTFTPRAEAMQKVLQEAPEGQMGSAELILRSKAITGDSHSPGVWKQSINRHGHLLAEYGIEKINNGTKEAVFRLKNGRSNDPF